MLLPLLIGSGLGLLNGFLNQGKAERNRALQAQTELWSPFTGLKPQATPDADVLGSTMQGGITGFGLGQSIDQNSDNQKMGSDWLQHLKASDDRRLAMDEARAAREGVSAMTGGGDSPYGPLRGGNSAGAGLPGLYAPLPAATFGRY